MGDQGNIVAGGAQAGAVREAGGGGGAVAGGRRGRGDPIDPTVLLPLEKNMNHDRPLIQKGRSKKEKEDTDIELPESFRVENDEVNMENEKLVKIYNDLKGIGKSYFESMERHTGKPRVTKDMERLTGNFADVVKKIQPQLAAVRRLGGEPFLFPPQVLKKLPNSLKRMMKDIK